MKNAQRTYMDFPKVTWCEISDITLVYQPQSSSYSSILIQIYNVVQHQHFTHGFIINIVWIKLIEGTTESFKDAY